MRIDRRALLAGGMFCAWMPGLALARNPARANPAAALAALEKRAGGRLGVAVLDARDGQLVGHRQDERFTMCSTFKLSLAALVLREMDAERIGRDERLPISSGDPVGHSPVLRAALERGETSLSILALARAAQIESDNGASNLLLARLGGPAGVTAFWRSLGDSVSRLDRNEPALNTSHDGDPRDTTSAAAMARSMRAILGADVLNPASRETLVAWMVDTQTGLRRLRAGFPAGWRAGDKTGTNPGDGSYGGKINDLAAVWPHGRPAPFLVTSFYESVKGKETRPQDEAVLAEAGRIAAGWIAAR